MGGCSICIKITNIRNMPKNKLKQQRKETLARRVLREIAAISFIE